VTLNSGILLLFSFISLVCYAIDIFLFFKLKIYEEESKSSVGYTNYIGYNPPREDSITDQIDINTQNMPRPMTVSEPSKAYDPSEGMAISNEAFRSSAAKEVYDYTNYEGMTTSVAAMSSADYSVNK